MGGEDLAAPAQKRAIPMSNPTGADRRLIIATQAETGAMRFRLPRSFIELLGTLISVVGFMAVRNLLFAWVA